MKDTYTKKSFTPNPKTEHKKALAAANCQVTMKGRFHVKRVFPRKVGTSFTTLLIEFVGTKQWESKDTGLQTGQGIISILARGIFTEQPTPKVGQVITCELVPSSSPHPEYENVWSSFFLVLGPVTTVDVDLEQAEEYEQKPRQVQKPPKQVVIQEDETEEEEDDFLF